MSNENYFKNIISLLIILFSFQLHADLPPVPVENKLSAMAPSESSALNAVEMKNQHDETISLNEKTVWLIFSTDKKLSDIINKQIEELKLTDLAKHNALYAADISKMPSLVTKMFALPKMKKYPFKMALDYDGQVSKSWPQKEGHVSVIKLDSLKVINVQYLKNEDEIKAALALINPK